MKKLFYIFLLFPSSLFGQTNLVPNPSFEDTIMCPPSSGNIDNAVGWSSYRYSPDYFNPCANSTVFYMGVPNNFAGHQYAFDGNSYAGLITYSANIASIREFIGVQLSSALITGVKYFASSNISRGDTIFFSDTTGCATNKFGYTFSTVPYTGASPKSINNFSHIHSDSIITEKVNWKKIFGSFIADSAYQYLIIGNFYDDANTDTFQCVDFSYYYLDLVCISTDSIYCSNYNGINIIPPKKFTIFPNPAKEYVNINCSFLSDVYDIAIYDVMGRKIIEKKNVDTKETYIDLHKISNGLFSIKITSKKESFYYKLLKQ